MTSINQPQGIPSISICHSKPSSEEITQMHKPLMNPDYLGLSAEGYLRDPTISALPILWLNIMILYSATPNKGDKCGYCRVP